MKKEYIRPESETVIIKNISSLCVSGIEVNEDEYSDTDEDALAKGRNNDFGFNHDLNSYFSF